MSPEQFVYWLQGYMEIANPDNLALEQIQVIRDHLQLVFTKVTPDRVNKNGVDMQKIEDILLKKKDLKCSPFTGPILENTADELEAMAAGLLTPVSC